MKIANLLPTLVAAVMIAGPFGSSDSVVAETVTDLCSNKPTNAAVATITPETFSYGGVDRHYCLYESSLIGGGTQAPLVIAFHGGGGNASILMNDNKHIIEHAERMGWIVAFPNGLPVEWECAGASLCLDNNWEAPDNIFFAAELISRIKAQGNVQDDRVHLIGFSGGAALIYRIAATPGFPHAIQSIATVAGAIGVYTPEEGFDTTQLNNGTSVNALLVQGSLDDRHPEDGGLGPTRSDRATVAHRTKVDIWRLATDTAGSTGVAVNFAAAPGTATATSYSKGTSEVVDVVDTDLEHTWPSWVMAVIVDFFN